MIITDAPHKPEFHIQHNWHIPEENFCSDRVTDRVNVYRLMPNQSQNRHTDSTLCVLVTHSNES